MQIGRDVVFFELFGLRRPSAGDEGARRPSGEDLLHLGLAGFGGRETEQAHAPRSRADALLRLGQELADFRSGHQRQGEEGQPAVGLHGCTERDRIADPCHRALEDRVTDAVRLRQRTFRGKRTGLARAVEVRLNLSTECLQDACRVDVLVSQSASASNLLPQRDGRPVVSRLRPRPAEDAVFGPPFLPADRFAAVQSAPLPALRRIEGRFRRQPELLAQHDARRSSQKRRRRRVRPDPPLHPVGDRQPTVQALQEQKRGFLTHSTAGLVALDDHSVKAGLLRGQSAAQAVYLQDHTPSDLPCLLQGLAQ